MKTCLLLYLWLAIAPLSLLAQNKHALVVAIGNYPRQTGWPTISSENDVPLVKQILRSQQFKDTVVLRDQYASRTGIINAMRALINRVGKGDKVLIHFSTHGQQITDQNGDEADGADEAIVCYGAPLSATGQFEKYTGDLHLRDEDLGALINELRAKLGSDGDVLLVVDACNSGTITRGQAKVRGTNTVLKLHLVNAQRTKKTRSKAPHPFMVSTLPVSQSGLAPYVAISAARANESNSECYLPDNKTPVGSLTYALNQAMLNPRRGESYRDLFCDIQSIMRQKVSGQTPEIEGDIDRELMGGKVVEQEPFFTLSDLQDEGHSATINSGQMTGTFVGAILSVCPTGTRDLRSCTSPIASATVVQAGLYSAIVHMSTAIVPDNMSKYWVFTKDRSFGSLGVTVGLDFQDATLKQQAITELSKQSLVQLMGTPDVVVFQDSLNPKKVGIRRGANGYVFVPPVAIQTQTDWQRIVEYLQQFAQSQFLLRLDATGYDMDVTMELVPMKSGSKTPTDTIDRTPFMEGGWLTFSHQNNEQATIKLTNRGNRTLYYNIVDIQPDGVVNMVVPRMKNGVSVGETPRELMVPPNSTIMVPVTITFSPPYGTEIFKLFATTEPVDLRSVMNVVTTRGSDSAGLPNNSNLTTQNLVFKIIERRK